MLRFIFYKESFSNTGDQIFSVASTPGNDDKPLQCMGNPFGPYVRYSDVLLLMLQWVKCAHVTEVYQFHDMIDMLLGSGYKKGITLFGYGYDFRQSNRIDKTMDGLKIKLDTAFKASGGRKVNIISHSMGGLLVSCLLSLHQDV
ncbi:hypothetical protein GIB67_015549 [Kingdonia uniflora]|uniref:Lecithin-cholesterol acyltransferase n=1 Tax=Kingdonia uniflora TaxID=39325 RepID=A0A7J7NRM0_9MAGN|nr:hypothetical protein GIB67_015549 [Kingdonia uniflora]